MSKEEVVEAPDGTLEQGDFKIKKKPKKPNTPCLLYTSPSPRDGLLSRMPSSA